MNVTDSAVAGAAAVEAAVAFQRPHHRTVGDFIDDAAVQAGRPAQVGVAVGRGYIGIHVHNRVRVGHGSVARIISAVVPIVVRRAGIAAPFAAGIGRGSREADVAAIDPALHTRANHAHLMPRVPLFQNHQRIPIAGHASNRLSLARLCADIYRAVGRGRANRAAQRRGHSRGGKHHGQKRETSTIEISFFMFFAPFGFSCPLDAAPSRLVQFSVKF